MKVSSNPVHGRTPGCDPGETYLLKTTNRQRANYLPLRGKLLCQPHASERKKKKTMRFQQRKKPGLAEACLEMELKYKLVSFS